ncbi:MAG: GTPase HflX [Chromatiales bacterium]|nr:GTPase HflX [Chromatiales bacterium]
MFERPKTGERALLVHIDLEGEALDEDREEFVELARSAGAQDVGLVSGHRRAPDARLFVGAGKAEEIRAAAQAAEAEVVIFDHALSPSQERNLEKTLGCRVLDRIGLILDIFAQRARSHEGKLQVELAQLRHMATRLVRGWTHLERQRGGIGLRGPGETQLETDRRLIAGRIRQIEQRLVKVQRQREQGRQARRRAEIPTVSLVGYTNAGKSTLFNRLTGAGVYAADQLFATLDPTLRRVDLPDGQAAILADTVGFIRHLPHDLVAAFKATLQETRDAQLLLHVIDAADERRDDNIAQVNEVLAEIGAEDQPRILVFNKIDLLEVPARYEPATDGAPARVWVSACTGDGMDLLREAIVRQIGPEMVSGRLYLPPAAGKLRAQLFDLGAVLSEQVDEGGGWHLDVRLPRRRFEELSRASGLSEGALTSR